MGVRYQASLAFRTAYELLAQLELISGVRKSFLYISCGYDFDPFPGGRAAYALAMAGGAPATSDVNPNGANAKSTVAQGGTVYDPTVAGSTPPTDPSQMANPFEMPGGQNMFALHDLLMQISELTRAANRANTILYTLDPRGLIGPVPDMADQYVTSDDWHDYTQNTIDTLTVIAHLTGGVAGVNTNDLKKTLTEIDAQESDYYILGYRSSNPDPAHRVRKIEIRLKRPDSAQYELKYPAEYTLPLPRIKK
jgi:hypothetical protein